MEHDRVPEIRFNELTPTHPKERFMSPKLADFTAPQQTWLTYRLPAL
jgi:hypothetical protein